MFPKIGVPQNGWFIREKPIKMDDLGVPLFLETPIFIYTVYFLRLNIFEQHDAHCLCKNALKRGYVKNAPSEIAKLCSWQYEYKNLFVAKSLLAHEYEPKKIPLEFYFQKKTISKKWERKSFPFQKQKAP